MVCMSDVKLPRGPEAMNGEALPTPAAFDADIDRPATPARGGRSPSRSSAASLPATPDIEI